MTRDVQPRAKLVRAALLHSETFRRARKPYKRKVKAAKYNLKFTTIRSDDQHHLDNCDTTLIYNGKGVVMAMMHWNITKG